MFDPAEDKYYDEETGQEYMSATTLKKKFFPPFRRDEISAQKAKEEGVSQEEILRRWDEKRDWGTSVHAMLEAYLVEGKEPETVQMTHIWKNLLAAWPLLNGHKKARIITEQIIACPILGIAGTADIIVVAKTPDANGLVKFGIADLKTDKVIYYTAMQSAKGDEQKMYWPFDQFDNCNYNQYIFQTLLYGYMAEINGSTLSGEEPLAFGSAIMLHVCPETLAARKTYLWKRDDEEAAALVGSDMGNRMLNFWHVIKAAAAGEFTPGFGVEAVKPKSAKSAGASLAPPPSISAKEEPEAVEVFEEPGEFEWLHVEELAQSVLTKKGRALFVKALKEYVEEGYAEAATMYLVADAIKKAFDEAQSEIKAAALASAANYPQGDRSINGVGFKIVPRPNYDYSNCEVWKELDAEAERLKKLKAARQKLMKEAASWRERGKGDYADENGEVVPPAEASDGSDTLQFDYK